MTFEALLSRWNGGVSRGAQTRLAKALGVAPNTVSQWATGVSRPDGDLRPRVAKALGVAAEALDALFSARRVLSAREDARSPEGVMPVYGPVAEEPFPFDFDGGLPEEFLPLTVLPAYGARGAGLKISGGRWSPLAEDGDYLLLAEGSVAPEGKWVVVRRADGCRLRRLKSGAPVPDDKERVLAVVMGRFRRA